MNANEATPTQTFYEATMTQWPHFAPDTSAHVNNGLGEELYKKQRTQCFSLWNDAILEQHLLSWKILAKVYHLLA